MLERQREGGAAVGDDHQPLDRREPQALVQLGAPVAADLGHRADVTAVAQIAHRHRRGGPEEVDSAVVGRPHRPGHRRGLGATGGEVAIDVGPVERAHGDGGHAGALGGGQGEVGDVGDQQIRARLGERLRPGLEPPLPAAVKPAVGVEGGIDIDLKRGLHDSADVGLVGLVHERNTDAGPKLCLGQSAAHAQAEVTQTPAERVEKGCRLREVAESVSGHGGDDAVGSVHGCRLSSRARALC